MTGFPRLSLSSRIFLATFVVVLLSLAISGLLTFILVQQLELQRAQDQLDQLASVQRSRILRLECATPPSTGLTCPASKLANPSEFVDRLAAASPNLPIDRILLLTRAGNVVFDTGVPGTVGANIAISRYRVYGGLQLVESGFKVGDDQYISSGFELRLRDPLGAQYILFARSKSGLAVSVAAQLAQSLVFAGVPASALALALALVLSRKLTSGLRQLRAAADDLGSGNYSRRVSQPPDDEVGAVANAFNRMAEAIQSAWMAQRDFLANASHELKTPLTSVLGFSHALLDGSLQTDGERALAATIINEEAQRLLRTSTQLLDLSRIQGGQLPHESVPVDVHEQLDGEINVWGQIAATRNITITEQTIGEPHERVRADPDLLHQIFTNLFDNAIKYAPAGSDIAVGIVSEQGVVRVEIVNRVTHPAPDPNRIFERFYRADPSRSSSSGGAGLGLAISRELATVLGATLGAQLAEDKSSIKFKLSLTAISSTSARAATTTPKATTPEAPR